jgi:hypothetical protein
MRPVVPLRIAAGLALLEAVLHTIGGVFGEPSPGGATTAVVAMKTNQFLLFGLTRSYWDFFIGFGLAITTFLAVEAMVFWFLGGLAETVGAKLRPVLWTFLIGYLALAVNAYHYIFFGPLINDILIVVCLGLASISLKNTGVVSS